MKFTPTSLTLNQLFNSANEQYVIPTYQRRYSWTEKQIWDLIEDVSQIDDGDQHLLGSIVCLAGPHKAGLNQLEVVDGQQRLTTVVILLECVRQWFKRQKQEDAARELQALLQAMPPDGQPKPKVLLDSIDASEFHDHIRQVEDRVFRNNQLLRAFQLVRDEAISDLDVNAVRKFVYKLRNQAVVIRLDVSEARDAFKLFETINNRGLRLSPTDIVKNFLLGNAARFGASALEQARRSWSDLLIHLDGTSTDAFFRYYLMSLLHVRIKKSEVVSRFKTLFMTQVIEAAKLPERHNYADVDESEDEEANEADETITDDSVLARAEKVSFKIFLSRLVLSAKTYSEVVQAKTGDSRTDRHLRNLRMIKAVQTYGFLMHLRVGGCDEKRFRQLLKITESFVLRRHVCRERSNETEALFARLCEIDPKAPLEPTRKAYRELCPSDDKFRSEFSSASFTYNLIDRARYCLERIEASLHGQHNEIQVLGSDEVHVEHIMPQKIKSKKAKEEYGDWVEYLGASALDKHAKFVDRIGNMTLFAGPLNIGASNNPFVRKKVAYNESAVIMTRELAALSTFKFKDIERRSQELAERAVEIWPSP